MDNLNEQILRAKELMGIINEQGSGDAAPESFTGSGKSCMAGYMWSEEEEDCVRMDGSYIYDVIRKSREIRDFQGELMDDNTMEGIIKNSIESLHEYSQEILKELDDKIFRGGRMSKKEAQRLIQQGKTISYISRTVKDKIDSKWREVKDKLITDIKMYRTNHSEKVLSSVGVVKLLSILDEKTREIVMDDYKQTEEERMRHTSNTIQRDVFDYVRKLCKYCDVKNTHWSKSLSRNIESRREGEVILPIMKYPKYDNSNDNGTEQFMSIWKRKQDNKPYFSKNLVRDLEQAIKYNLDEL